MGRDDSELKSIEMKFLLMMIFVHAVENQLNPPPPLCCTIEPGDHLSASLSQHNTIKKYTNAIQFKKLI